MVGLLGQQRDKRSGVADGAPFPDVLQHETGQPAERIPRPVLAAELKFQHTDQQLPLLYGILAYLRSDADTQP